MRSRSRVSEWLLGCLDAIFRLWRANPQDNWVALLKLLKGLPIVIGWRTLDRLRTGRILDAAQRIKIPRSALQWLAVRALLSHPLPSLWRRLG